MSTSTAGTPASTRGTIRRWEAGVNRFGYSLLDLRRADTAALPPPPEPNPA